MFFRCVNVLLIVFLISFLISWSVHPSTNTEWFSTYKKNYFVTGSSDTPFGNQGKFQISVKAKFLTEDVYDTNLYFAYTQQSFYDYLSPFITGNPVYESSYTPELFVRKKMTGEDNPIKHIDIGIRHQSNGQGEVIILDSRFSPFNNLEIDRRWGNRVFLGVKLRPIDYFSIRYEIWGDSFYGDNLNYDLDDYLGNQEIVFALTSDDFYSVGRVTLYLKMKLGLREGLELPYEFSLEIEPFIKYFLPSIYLQWYNGYAESLRFYNEKKNVFRIGFSYPIDDLR